MTDTPNTTDLSADDLTPEEISLGAVRKFVEQRTGMQSMDPDEIHSLHVGTEREARLTLTDLRELLAAVDRYSAMIDDFYEIAEAFDYALTRRRT